MYPDDQSRKYNVKNMSIQEWMDSEPMRQARSKMFGDNRISFCKRCYWEEDHGTNSKRLRGNHKSVIFTKLNFQESYSQSPGHRKFEHSRNNDGQYSGMPIDVHIDLGNYCNLQCKMCSPQASSSIAGQYMKWNINDASKYLGTDWTRDQGTWERICDELAGIKELHNIHFMGGETLITKRFEDFVDFMLARGRTDLNFSFVTNGTVYNRSLLEKLKRFNRVGIEVSVETMTPHNAYQRQGTNMNQLMDNLKAYTEFCDGRRITLTIRPSISLLSIGNFPSLLEYCLINRLVVKSLMVYNPGYMDARILPKSVKQLYSARYDELESKYGLESVDASSEYNSSDPNQINFIIKNHIDQCRQWLRSSRPADSDSKLAELVSWCRRWDNVHGYDALPLFPELTDIFIDNGYKERS